MVQPSHSALTDDVKHVKLNQNKTPTPQSKQDSQPQDSQPQDPQPQESQKPQKSNRPSGQIAVSNKRSRRDVRRKKSGVRQVTRNPSPESIAKANSVKGKGKSRVLAIIGNGPSIGEVHLELLKEIPKVDIMSINTPDKRIWPTTYWAFFDQSQWRRHQEIWRSYNGTIFNSTAVKQKENSMQFKNLSNSGFSKDLTKGIYIGRSSVYAAMQIAYWMNYDHTYIFGCLPDGEKIYTNRGMVPIDSLINNDLIYTSDGFRSWTGYQRRWHVGTLISITTRMNNIPLRVTEEHPILVRRDNVDTFVKADNLSIGDVAVWPIDNTITESKHDEDFWWLVGVYAAEGYIRKISNKYSYATLCVGKHEELFQNDIIARASKVFGCKTTRDEENRTACELIVNNDQFGKFVEEHIGRGSTTKFLSYLVMTLPLNKQAAFIDGYCRGDGSLFIRKRTQKHECTFSTASESLAEGLQKILLRFNVISSLVRSNRPSGFDRKNTGNFGIRHHINIIGESLDNLADRCGWCVNTSKKRRLHGVTIDNGNLLTPIRKLTKLVFSGYVNNIEIDGPHTFGSRLIMTHNCDMNPDGLDGKMHFYGQNPDVNSETRGKRFEREANSYNYASNTLSEEERSKYTFCTDYNPWEFVNKFNLISHKNAIKIIRERIT